LPVIPVIWFSKRVKKSIIINKGADSKNPL